MAESSKAPIRLTLPLIERLKSYTKAEFVGDATAGVVVAIMLVPQAMAYALLAGLPPEVGLYTSILPLIVYGLTGSAGMLAVGPTAIVSLMTGEALGLFTGVTDAEKIGIALTLTLLIGVLMLVMGTLKMGRVVNFLSHPVLSGFASAAAIVIALSQLRHLLGLPIPRGLLPHEIILFSVREASAINLVTLGVGLASLAILLIFKYGVRSLLRKQGVKPFAATFIVRMAPLVIVVGATFLVFGLRLDQTAGIAIVGDVPPGLPAVTLPRLNVETVRALLPSAIAIALVGYTESISVAKALAAKIRQRVDADQEFVAIGLANLAAAFTGGYPAAGGLARSAVNFAAGARTGLASIITAALMALTVLFLMPLFTFLPQAALAAIIMVAVTNLFDFETIALTWRSNKADFAALVITFVGVLVIGVEVGILLGLVLSVAYYMWRTSEPHIAEVGRVGSSEHFRNVRNFEVHIKPDVLAIRVDENLYFANAGYLEQTILDAVADRPELNHIVLIFSAVNYIDTSAIDTLEKLSEALCGVNVDFSLAEVKQPVMAQLNRADFFAHAQVQGVYLSTHEALESLASLCLDEPLPAELSTQM